MVANTKIKTTVCSFLSQVFVHNWQNNVIVFQTLRTRGPWYDSSTLQCRICSGIQVFISSKVSGDSVKDLCKIARVTQLKYWLFIKSRLSVEKCLRQNRQFYIWSFQLFLPLVENDEITESMRVDAEEDPVSEFVVHCRANFVLPS